MKLIGIELLDQAKTKHPDVKNQINAWVAEVKDARWDKPHDIKARYASASFLKNNNVVFNIKGNHYRLLAKANYIGQIVLVKKFGTHNEYMTWT